MARPKGDNHNITARDCTNRVGERTKIYDARCPGFYVSVTPSGSATFNFKFTNPVTKKRESLEIGKFDPVELPVEKARGIAFGYVARVGAGEDITAAERKGKAQAAKLHGKKVGEIIDDYVKWMQEPVKKKDGEMRPRIESWKDRSGYLERFTRPRLGGMVASEVENDHIAEIQIAIAAGKYVGAEGKRFKASVSNARNFRTSASAMFEWAAEAGRKFVKVNPCHNLPALDPEHKRERVLSAAEIKTLWHGLDDPDLPCSRSIALALKFELVTMLRTKEFLSAHPEECKALGTADAQVHVPLKRVKKRRVIICPLSDLAQEIIDDAWEDKNQVYVFNGKFDGEPLDDKALGHAVRGKVNKKTGAIEHPGILHHLKMKHWTPHDLRRTAATLAGDLGFTDAQIAQCLDHSLDDTDDAAPTVTGVYVRSKRIGEKRKVLDAVAAKLREIIGAPAKRKAKAIA